MTRHTLTLSPFDYIDRIDRVFPSAVGFDRVFDILNHSANMANKAETNFPPYSIVKRDDYNYQLELAVAGFNENEIEIVAEKNKLTVAGNKDDKDDRQYIMRGIAGRNFTREFILADTIVVRNVKLVYGILIIELENVIPEEQKPRKIPINNVNTISFEPKAELLVEQK